MHKNTKTFLLVNTSPSKLQQRIGRLVGSMRPVQKCNVYLKSRLEDQQEKHGIAMEMDECKGKKHRCKQIKFLVQRGGVFLI